MSALRRPWALLSSTDLKELEQTSSAKRSVWCAAVMRTGRISCSVTAMPRSASAQAASLPASPPPTTTALRSPPTPPARPPLRSARVRTSGTCVTLPSPWSASPHAEEAAARAGDRDRPVPRRVVALGIAQASEEVAPLLGAALRQIAHAALRALHAERHGTRVLAGGEARAREELAVATGLDDHGRAAFLADLVGRLVRHLVASQRPREPALGVARARDERPEAPALHHEAAVARRALLLGQLRQVVHLVDQLLDVDRFECLGERPPEVAQHLLPRQVAFLDLVELVFHLSREAHVEHVGERALHHLPHRLPQRRRREPAVLGGGVPAHLESGDDARIRRRAADPQALELLHQARLAEARRRLGEMLVGRDLLDRDDVAPRERWNRRQVLDRLRFLGLVGLVIQHVVAVEQHPRAGRPEHVAPEIEVHLGGLDHRRRHLRRHESQPDQLVQLELARVEMLLQIVGAPRHVAGPDRLVRVLHPRVALPPLVHHGGVGQVAFAVLLADVIARLGDGRIGHAYRVGAHVGDEAHGALLPDLDPLVQLLGEPHRDRGREAQLLGGFLLQGAGAKRGWRGAGWASTLRWSMSSGLARAWATASLVISWNRTRRTLPPLPSWLATCHAMASPSRSGSVASSTRSAALAAFLISARVLAFSLMVTYSGVKPFSTSTPSLRCGRSRTCPTVAFTV